MTVNNYRPLRTGRGSTGFTLVELMLGVFLMALLLVALWSLTASFYQSLQAGMHSSRVKGAELASLTSLTNNLRQTTYIRWPNSPLCPSGPTPYGSLGSCAVGDQYSDTLIGCTNYDPYVSGGYIVNSNGVSQATVYQYCVDAAGKMWYYSLPATDPTVICPPLTSAGPPVVITGTTCGLALPGYTLLAVAEQVSHDPDPTCTACAGYFHRPAGSANTVELHYQVGLGTAAVVVNTVVQTMKTVTSPTP